ncbi:MAG: hypothetical protein NC331_08305 [Lachnospiraceae bacterium]|nr:hypothetical protein [Lachnospiraceae bacterium]MCM1239373.1 hypothetical protein [Lachnospiraceae bacterium]
MGTKKRNAGKGWQEQGSRRPGKEAVYQTLGGYRNTSAVPKMMCLHRRSGKGA